MQRIQFSRFVTISMLFSLAANPHSLESTMAVTQESTRTEIDKLIKDVAGNDNQVREKANTRLVEIGVPALSALQEARLRTNQDVETQRNLSTLINAIRRAHSLAPWVSGMEFKSVFEKERLVPDPGKTTAINIQLKITNTTNTTCRLYLADSLKVQLRDSTGNDTLKFNGYGRDKAVNAFSRPLIQNDSFTMQIKGKIHWVKGKLSLVCQDMFSATWINLELAKGKYGLILLYSNNRKASDEREPLWVGAAETFQETIIVK